MPPNYYGRFTGAYLQFKRTLQREYWQSFLNQIRTERANTNVVVRRITRLGPHNR
jgi:hypothetical protein